MPPLPQFQDKGYKDEFDWPSPLPITDIALTKGELNSVPPPTPSFDLAVIESDLDIVPSPSTTDMAVIYSEFATVLPLQPIDDCIPNTGYLDLIIPPALDFQDDYKPPFLVKKEPQSNSATRDVIGTTKKVALEVLLLPPPEFWDDYDLPSLEEDRSQ